MELIRESALFTTILHCVMAASLPINGLPQTSGAYSVESTSFGILEIPTFDKDSKTDATIFYVNPRPATVEKAFEAKTYHDIERDKPRNKQHLPKHEVPSATLKGTGPNYPLSTPKVKLDFVGTSGMLPVKIHSSSLDKTETAKELTPTNSHKSTKSKKAEEKLNNEVDFIKFIRDLFSKPTEYAKQEDMPEDYLTSPVSENKKIPKNNFQFSSSDQPSSGWNSGILLNPMNIYQTTPGMDLKKDQVDKSFQYNTPKYTVLPELIYSRPYNTEVEQVRNNQYTSTYKTDYAVNALQPTNVDYPTNPGYEYIPERAYQYTPYEPERAPKQHDYSKKEDAHHEVVTQNVPYKNNLPVNVAKPSIEDHGPAKLVVKEKVILSPVPASLSLLQRQQIILLNTVAGLPGGTTTGLDAVRAG